ncbi:LBL_2463 family protein [Leptospira santarosai]|uniref:LBL_2463 family protein n=1 Tax=Leptospira santarosai TaxID=28183 RepID=UPI0002D975A8|nr:hypothetical protein [Leptospira santarosai]MDI7219582.1 hypothetical protein [Leptospira santarosai]ONF83493.1 hypothetical protein BWD13_18425 [Leptospira santarosai serovar Grippotyphosa]UZN06705.1 hypothetical protein M5D10_12920 [Leptospira santarosai]
MSQLTTKTRVLTKEKFEVKTIVGLESLEELKRVKDFVSKIYTESGYSHSSWKNINYDPWSTWFYIEDNNEILAAMRIIEKKLDNVIPLEVAVVWGQPPLKQYKVQEDNVADWNSVSFLPTSKSGRACTILFKSVAKHCLDKNYSMVYGMYNPESKGIERIYFRAGVAHSQKYPDLMYFPGFYMNGEFCHFRVIEIKKESLQKISSYLG